MKLIQIDVVKIVNILNINSQYNDFNENINCKIHYLICRYKNVFTMRIKRLYKQFVKMTRFPSYIFYYPTVFNSAHDCIA